nr:hypothetical protein [Thiohalobacter thiocyanaticus]
MTTRFFSVNRETLRPYPRATVLQLALPALVADRTVQGMIDEQELHHRLLRLAGIVGIGPDLHAVGDRRGAGRQRLGRLIHLHQAHAAVGRDRQLLVVAETRHRDAVLVGDLDEHLALAGRVGPAIDLDADGVLGRNLGCRAHAAAPVVSFTMDRLCSIM